MIDKNVARFASLQTNKNQKYWPAETRYQAPNKPLLLMTVLDLFELSRIKENLIRITPELRERFASYWYWALPSNLKGDLAVCFFHLKNEGFWHLVAMPGKEHELTRLNQAPTLAQLEAVVVGARLDEDLFQFMQDRRNREMLRNTLISTYFAPSVQEYLHAEAESSRTRDTGEKTVVTERATSAADRGDLVSSSKYTPDRLPPGWSIYEMQNIPEFLVNIKELHLPTRVHNALKRHGVQTIAQLLSMAEVDLWSVRNFGSQSVALVQNALADFLQRVPYSDGKPFEEPPRSISTAETSDTAESERWTILEPALLQAVSRASVPVDEIPIARLGLPLALEASLRTSARVLSDVLGIDQTAYLALSKRDRQLLVDHLERYATACLSLDSVVNEKEDIGLSPVYKALFNGVTLESLISAWLDCLTDRQRLVIEYYYGLFNEEAYTLEKIGQLLGVTRERVRQIKKRAFHILKNCQDSIRSLGAFLEHIFSYSLGIVSTEKWASEISAAIEMGAVKPTAALRLLLEINDEIAYYDARRLRCWIRHDLDAGRLSSILKKARTQLKAIHVPTSITELLELVEQPQDTTGFLLTYDLFHALLDAHDDFQIEGELVMLVEWTEKITDEIILALRKIGEPAHYSVITEITNSLLPHGSQTTDRAVHTKLGQYTNLFVRVGHGIFGLKEWGLHDDGNLANAAHRVLTEAGQPLHVEVITDRVLKTWRVRHASVGMAIANDDRFVSIGSGIYWLRTRIAESATENRAVDFADLYRDRLMNWQLEQDQTEYARETSTFDEVEKIRSAGLDLFE